MPKRPEFAEVLDTLKNSHMTGIDADRVHDLNSITGIPFVRSFAQLASDPLTDAAYLPVLADKIRVWLVLAGSLAEMGVHLAEELKVDVPPEILRLQAGLAKILGKGKASANAHENSADADADVDPLRSGTADPEIVKHGKSDAPATGTEATQGKAAHKVK